MEIFPANLLNLFNANSIGLLSLDAEQRILTFNHMAKALAQKLYKIHFQVGDHVFSRLPETGQNLVNMWWQNVVQSHTAQKTEISFDIDNTHYDFEIYMEPIWDSYSNLQQILITFYNISEYLTIQRLCEEYIRQLEIMQQLNSDLTQSLDLANVLRIALNAAIQLSGAFAGEIALYEDETLRVVEVSNESLQHRLDYIITPDQGLVGQVLTTQKAEWVKNVQENTACHPLDATVLSQMVIPLLAHDRLIGILNLAGNAVDSFSPEGFEFIMLLAGRIAFAVENAWLYARLQQNFDELSRTHRHVQELEALKTQIIRVASHDLRNPLNTITGSCEVLEALFANNMTDAVASAIYYIRQGSKRIDKITRDILTLERVQDIRQNGIRHEEVLLEQIVKMAYEEHLWEAREQIVAYQLELPPTSLAINGDAALLREACSNLISNAIKYTPKGGQVVVRLYQKRKTALVEVEDTGFGIPKDQQKNVFDPFVRIQTQQTKHIRGTGLGLNLVRSIAEQHGGTVHFRSTYGKGSRFWCELPLQPANRLT